MSPLFEESHPACLPVFLFSCVPAPSFSVSRQLLSSRDHETRKYLISASQDYDGGIDFDFSVFEDFECLCVRPGEDNFATCFVHCNCNTREQFAYF